MKKLALSFLLTSFFATIYAQKNFEIGTQIGLASGDVSKEHKVNLGLNLAYTRNVSENFKIGVATGYSHFFNNKTGTDLGYFPVAAKMKYYFPNSKLFADLDLGYAFVNNGMYKGGLYAYPKIGLQLKNSEIFVGYQFLNSKYKYDYFDGTNTIPSNTKFNLGSFNLGYNFKF
ncbi:hypothetical protein [Cloacibacterium normanense]